MFDFLQEATLPKLSQTSIYGKFDQTSNISQAVVQEIANAKQYRVMPNEITELTAIMKLNGDPIAKRAVDAFEKGQIIVIDNKETSKIPITLPYITISKENVVAYVFADKIITNMKSNREYTNLMAALEAAYIAIAMARKPELFTNNAGLTLILSDIYTKMATGPLEQKLFMKGENLDKALLYTMAFFYKTMRGETMDVNNIPYRRVIATRIIDGEAKGIFQEVKDMPTASFLDLLELIKKINPVRYKDIDSMYLTHFISTCGAPIVFALENPAYLFMLVTSSEYKTPVTQLGMNKVVQSSAKKAITVLNSMNI